MTSLSTLVIDVLDAAETADPSAMVLALQGVHRLLAAVQLAQAAAQPLPAACEGHSFQLQIELNESSVSGDWHAHPRVWQAIGQLPGLNKLQLSTSEDGLQLPSSSFAHMPALEGLASSLHTLQMALNLDQQQDQVVDYSVLGSLSHLTSLGLPLAAERQGLSSISSCSQLQYLSLEFTAAAGAAQQVIWQPSELSAMSQLTQLTKLLVNGTACGDTPGSSLRQLQHLQVKPALPHAAVAALAHLTCLTQLMCGWEQQQGPAQATARCAAVRDMHVLHHHHSL
jgi:hypothetical protein